MLSCSSAFIGTIQLLLSIPSVRCPRQKSVVSSKGETIFGTTCMLCGMLVPLLDTMHPSEHGTRCPTYSTSSGSTELHAHHLALSESAVQTPDLKSDRSEM